MKVEIDVEIPDGYEATGWLRPPKAGEWYLDGKGEARAVADDWKYASCLILREKPLRYEDFCIRDGVSVDECGNICVVPLKSPPWFARDVAKSIQFAADHVDRVNAQKAGA